MMNISACQVANTGLVKSSNQFLSHARVTLHGGGILSEFGPSEPQGNNTYVLLVDTRGTYKLAS